MAKTVIGDADVSSATASLVRLMQNYDRLATATTESERLRAAGALLSDEANALALAEERQDEALPYLRSAFAEVLRATACDIEQADGG